MIHGIYNFWTGEPDLEIFPGEEICPWCEGTGIRRVSQNALASQPYLWCIKCKGDGKVDWVSKIMR